MLRWLIFAFVGWWIWTKIRPPEPKRLKKKRAPRVVPAVDGQSPFTILGVAEDASDDEIHKAYLALIKAHHPDRAAPDERAAAEQQTRLLNRAYDALKGR